MNISSSFNASTKDAPRRHIIAAFETGPGQFMIVTSGGRREIPHVFTGTRLGMKQLTVTEHILLWNRGTYLNTAEGALVFDAAGGDSWQRETINRIHDTNSLLQKLSDRAYRSVMGQSRTASAAPGM